MRIRILFLIILGIGLFSVYNVPVAAQSTITVDSTADDTTAADGNCTLREAITNANNNSDSTSGDCMAGSATDTIEFNIAGAGPHTITVGSTLSITNPVFIDGLTQSGADCRTELMIVIDGSAVPSTIGVSMTNGASGSTIRGLVINNFTSGGSGMRLSDSDNNIIQCNFIGTDSTGTIVQSNLFSLVLQFGSNNNLVGADGDGINDANEGNLISGNTLGPWFVNTGTINNTFAGNLVGTDITGTLDLGNATEGVTIQSGANNNIVGTNGDGNGDDIEGNLISGNGRVAVRLIDADNTTIAGNKIGTDISGTVSIPNQQGILIQTTSINTIVGTDGDGISDTLEGNLISGNSQNGIDVSSDCSNQVIAGNYIGTDITGMLDLGNGINGIAMQSANNRIGTDGDGISDSAESNIVSGNNSLGINIGSSTATNNIVAGNYIGTNITGTGSISNTTYGISINSSASSNIIGTNGDGNNDGLEGNLISGNTVAGIFLSGASTASNRIAGNLIGTNITGTADLGNGNAGILSQSSANNSIIGTNGDGVSDALEGNLISGNDTGGITLAASNNNRVAGNLIGTNLSGTAAIANNNSGISIQNGTTGTIVGTNGDGVSDALEANLISGNIVGVSIDSTSSSNIVAGNQVGTNLAGTAAISNTFGIYVSGGNNQIGTDFDGISDSLEGNLVSGNSSDGITFISTTAINNTLAGNIIGLNSGASAALANGGNGVSIQNSASSNTIGGANDTQSNFIGGNSASGIYITGASSTGNVINNNYIGTNVTSANLANGTNGIRIDATGTSTTTVSNNWIFYHPTTGILLSNAASLGAAGLSEQNCLYQNMAGVNNTTGANTFFENNWWGTSTGPSGMGTGGGDSVSANVDYIAFLTIAPTGCPLLVTVTATDPDAAENPLGTGEFTFDLGTVNSTGVPITVNYSITGTATNGTDYSTISANVDIPNGSQTVTLTITPTDDLDIEGVETVILTLTSTSNPSFGVETTPATVTITDNDVAGITVSPITIAIAEGGATATFDISAQVNPGSSVSIPVTTDGQCTVSSNPVVLAAGSTIAVTITVTAVDDLNIEGAHTCAITVGDPTSADGNFDALTDADTADVTANVTDNDTAGITVSPTTIAIAEGGATATFDISASVNPGSSVSIPVTTDGQCTVSVNPVVLAAGGTTPVTVTVTAVDDLDIEGAHTCAITVGDPTSADTNFDALTDADAANVTANVTDNDVAGITVSPTTIAIAEGGATATFDVSAQVNPGSSVSIPVTTDGQCTVSTNPVVLPAGSTTAVTVTVTAVDDLNIEGAHSCAITVGDPSSTDGNFDALTDADTADVTANVTDNDTAGILVTPISIAIAEGGATATFDISAQVNPTSSVSIPVTTDGQCTVSSNPVVLPAGSTTAVTVTVTAVDDLDVEGVHNCVITVGDPTSADTNFDVLADADTADVTVNVTDNDTAGILVTPTTIAIAEGGATATFDISGSTNTSATVDVPITSDGQCLLSTVASPVPSTSLTVTLPVGSSTVITVIVEAVDDNVAEGAHVCVITTGDPVSADTNYDALGAADVADVTANVTDNDTAGISLASIIITEGAAGVGMDVLLLSEPTGDVTITLTPDAQCTLSTTSLTFTDSAGATPWDVPQTVTVTAVDDNFAEGAHICVITYSAASSDPNYTIGSTTHNVDVVDNDTPGISLASITVTEGAAGIDMDVMLFTEPTGDVTITLTPDAQCTLSTTTLTFTDSAGTNPWNVPQSVTVTAVDDTFAEGAHICVITYSAASSDTNYTISSTTHNVDVVDNDTPGVLIAQTGGNTRISEDGASDRINITLATEPTGDVTITLSTNGQCTVNPATLVFTDSAGANPWNVPQVVTITAVDDSDIEGGHVCVIRYTTSSADPDYGSLTGQLRANVADNDSVTAAQPQIGVFDPAISKLGELLPGQTGILGEELEWVVTVSNLGTVVGTNVTITDTLTLALQIDSVDAPGATVTISGQTVIVVYPTLAVGQTVQFSIFTTVLSGTTVENTACVNAANQGAEECASAISAVVSVLPSTGESPMWRYGLLVGIALTGLLGFALYRYQKPKIRN